MGGACEGVVVPLFVEDSGFGGTVVGDAVEVATPVN